MYHEKIIIIDNDADSVKTLASIINEQGFSVIEAADANSAFEKINAEKPSIMFIDIKNNDFELIRRVKEVVPFLQFVVIGNGDVNTAVNTWREGGLDYLKKPVDTGVLTVILSAAEAKIREYKSTQFSPVLLILEDDNETRDFLGRMMGKENWDVCKASNGDEAIAQFKTHKIDVVISDVKMPGNDGLNVLHELRVLSPDFEAVMVTGYGDDESVLKAWEEGAMNFVKKPIDINQLQMFLSKALEVLNLKRAFKYRGQELNFSKKIIEQMVAKQ
ncbi:MAG: response regulator [Candidatus Omnitrophica bacterium]|nr:response regulator [Candidatus Omnitrophota bacterium]